MTGSLQLLSYFILTTIVTSSLHHSYSVNPREIAKPGFQFRSTQLQQAGYFHTASFKVNPSKGLYQYSDPQTFTEVVDHMPPKLPTSGNPHLECWKLIGVLTMHKITPHSQESNDKLGSSSFLMDLMTFSPKAGLPLEWRATKGKA